MFVCFMYENTRQRMTLREEDMFVVAGGQAQM